MRRIADAGTDVRVSIVWPRKTAVANIPRRMKPGFCSSIRTLAVRMFGSRIGRMLLTRPVSMRSG